MSWEEDRVEKLTIVAGGRPQIFRSVYLAYVVYFMAFQQITCELAGFHVKTFTWNPANSQLVLCDFIHNT
jgi:hypothetical protein